MEAVIDTRIKAKVNFNNVLHWFWARRRTGMTILDLKFAQEIASMEHITLFVVLLDFSKAYYMLDRGACSRPLRVTGRDRGYRIYYRNFGINRR